MSTTYRQPIQGDWELFVRGDAIYRSKSLTGATNLAYIDGYTLVNGRVGMEKEGLRLELYIKNVFDEDTWVNGSEGADFSVNVGNGFDFSHMGVTLIPQDKQTVGFRASYLF